MAGCGKPTPVQARTYTWIDLRQCLRAPKRTPAHARFARNLREAATTSRLLGAALGSTWPGRYADIDKPSDGRRGGQSRYARLHLAQVKEEVR